MLKKFFGAFIMTDQWSIEPFSRINPPPQFWGAVLTPPPHSPKLKTRLAKDRQRGQGTGTRMQKEGDLCPASGICMGVVIRSLKCCPCNAAQVLRFVWLKGRVARKSEMCCKMSSGRWAMNPLEPAQG